MVLKEKVRTNCPYYPCHDLEHMDCSLCYCPFYPCGDSNLGNWTNDIWDCSGCDVIHKEEVAKIIIMTNFSFGRVTNNIPTLQKINKEIEEYNRKMELCR